MIYNIIIINPDNDSKKHVKTLSPRERRDNL